MTQPIGLATKLAEITAALDWVKKRGTNQAQGYAYVMAEDIFADVRTELAKRNVAFLLDLDPAEHVQITKADGKTIFSTALTGRYSFVDGGTGEVLTGGCVGYAHDSGDKATWKAWTGLLKYVLRTVFLLPTGDDPERDDQDAPRARTQAVAPRPIGVPTPPAPATTEPTSEPPVGLTAKQQGLLRARYAELGITTPEHSKAMHVLLTGKHSTKQMTQADFDIVIETLKDVESAKLLAAKAA